MHRGWGIPKRRDEIRRGMGELRGWDVIHKGCRGCYPSPTGQMIGTVAACVDGGSCGWCHSLPRLRGTAAVAFVAGTAVPLTSTVQSLLADFQLESRRWWCLWTLACLFGGSWSRWHYLELGYLNLESLSWRTSSGTSTRLLQLLLRDCYLQPSAAPLRMLGSAAIFLP